jgi:two-component system sensor histidine kinase VanS
MALLVLLIIFLGINIYISTYYYGSKVDDMIEIADSVDDAYEESETLIELSLKIDYIAYIFGGEINVYDETVTIDMLIQEGFFYKKGLIVKEVSHNDMTAYICDNKMGGQNGLWLMYGQELSNGKIVVLGIPVESIDNTVNAIKGFFVIIGILATFISAIFAFILAQSMSRPITKLNSIAKEMGKLNFKAKYIGNRKDEIGELGYTLNELTTYLEKTINDLKHELSKEKHLDILRKRFVGQVSHELQTPLSVINGYIEALSDGVVDGEEEIKEYYIIIEEEALKMSKMIKELLDLSQLESGNFNMKKERFDIGTLLDNIHNTHKFIAENKGITWLYEPLGNSCIICGDEGRIEQAFRNIIHNAFKHTPEGGNIQIIAKQVVNQDKIKITFKNNGDPIPEDQLSFIWESFYKAKTSDKKQGTGLGLAISANIFNYHEIAYSACNTEDGVAFELVIPLSQCE